MKKLFIPFFMLIFSYLPLKGQQSKAPVDFPKYTYCEIYTNYDNLGTKITVQINDGKTTKLLSNMRYDVESDQPIVLIEIMKNINIMAQDGWELVQIHTTLSGYKTPLTTIYHYILKKRIA